MTSERGLTHAEAMDAIFERFFRRSPEAGYSFAEFKADAMTILEATAAAEQRLRASVLALHTAVCACPADGSDPDCHLSVGPVLALLDSPEKTT